MVVKVENVNSTLTGKCQGLSNLMVQGLYFRQGYNSSEYVVQYSQGNQATIVSGAPNNEPIDWATTTDTHQIDFKQIANFDGDLSGHTQTVYEDQDLVITGLRAISFNNLKEILSVANDTQKQGFYDTTQGDDASWTTFNLYMSNGLPELSKGDEKWARNFVALPNGNSMGTIYNGEYIIITGADYYAGQKPLRDELAFAPNRNHYLLAINDDAGKEKTGTLHTVVFGNDIMGDLSSKYDDITESLASLWNGEGFPTSVNVGTNPARIQEALDFYHQLLDDDDLVIDLDRHHDDVVKKHTYTLDDFRDNLNRSGSISFQGFGIDNEDNLYISSGFGPNKDFSNKPNNHIFKIESNESNKIKWIDIDCNLAFGKFADNEFPEIENIQVISSNQVLVSLGVHMQQNDGSIQDENRIYRISWSE